MHFFFEEALIGQSTDQLSKHMRLTLFEAYLFNLLVASFSLFSQSIP